MEIELEFTKPGPGAITSSGLAFLLRMCRKFPTFKEISEDGMTIYYVEFSDKTLNGFVAIMDRVQWWKNISITFDGELVGREECWKRIWDLRRGRRMSLKRTNALCIDVLKDMGGLDDSEGE